ncbi:HelD family protein [Sanguibacter sp. Leaf3]|uniref:HelD family protein n=1 Tax=Sanguibacter sp. Leaf3 TaxID=1736209 RepID=UPI0006FD851C|nr:AAA family ATPase [Sanguibacter sp. Leaf3]KQT97855.1 AAA family ATPase [Sanguibacter sp. Leaf3]
MHTTTSVFDLPEHLSAKADPRLVELDEQHFAALSRSLEQTVTSLTARLAAVRRSPAGSGQTAVERDAEIHRLVARLRGLRSYGPDLCLGRTVSDDAADHHVYVGRQGLVDAAGDPLLVDWRSPAAEAFFAATPAHPMSLASRRRYRWHLGRVRDYWDEPLTAAVVDGAAVDGAAEDGHGTLPDARSAFVASLGGSRTGRMRDVLGTIQGDQDAIIRAGSRGTLVVDGGPGTGKTVVALHRCAYLLYTDPSLGHRRGGMLVVGPHEPYLDYVADVLPDLGEDGVLTCTLADLVPEGADAVPEASPEVARLKGTTRMVEAVDAAVRFFEQPPAEGLLVQPAWAEVWLSPGDWTRAFGSPDPGTPHDEALDSIWEEILDILVGKHQDEVARDDDVEGSHRLGRLDGVDEFDVVDDVVDDGLDVDDGRYDGRGHGDSSWPDDGAGGASGAGGVPTEVLRAALRRDPELVAAVDRAWPMLDAAEVVADLWSVPAYLRLCAPWLSPDEREALRRPAGSPWTDADLPLLDAARHRVGDPTVAARRVRHDATVASEREYRSHVVDSLVEADDDPEGTSVMLRSSDLADALAGAFDTVDRRHDALAGPFAHVVVDEAQELTDAEWQMVLRRCPSRSLTVVGDRAQARRGFREPWGERLQRVGIDEVTVAPLTYSYRTPAPIMAAAEAVVRAEIPDANVPVSVRTGGLPVLYGRLADLHAIVDDWLDKHPDGTACVVGAPDFTTTERVRSLPPQLTKGLEFDLVVLVDPAALGTGLQGAVDRYVTMTRATEQLVLLTPDPT